MRENEIDEGERERERESKKKVRETVNKRVRKGKNFSH